MCFAIMNSYRRVGDLPTVTINEGGSPSLHC
jgi:hypothetical protein